MTVVSQATSPLSSDFSILLSSKPCSWVTFSPLYRTELGYPKSSPVYHFYYHICFSVDPCPPSLSFPAFKQRSNISLSCFSVQLQFQGQLPLHNCYSSSLLVTWSNSFLSHISDSFQIQALLCTVCFLMLFYIKCHKLEMLGEMPENTPTALVIPCSVLERLHRNYMGNPISTISKPDFWCCLEIILCLLMVWCGKWQVIAGLNIEITVHLCYIRVVRVCLSKKIEKAHKYMNMIYSGKR